MAYNLYEYLIKKAKAKHPIKNISINKKVKEEKPELDLVRKEYSESIEEKIITSSEIDEDCIQHVRRSLADTKYTRSLLVTNTSRMKVSNKRFKCQKSRITNYDEAFDNFTEVKLEFDSNNKITELIGTYYNQCLQDIAGGLSSKKYTQEH